MSDSETLRLQREGTVAIFTLNRPNQDNALSRELLTQLREQFLHLSSYSPNGPSIRAAVLTGAGGCFSTGADLSELAALSVPDALAFSQLGQSTMAAIEAAPFPVLAAVDGFALGGGLELALACDFILASDRAVFGLPEIRLGIIPGFGGTQRLVRRIGLPQALELGCTGKTLSADRAERLGLVNRLVPPERLLGRARAEADAIAHRAPLAMVFLKSLMKQALDLRPEDGYAREAAAFAQLFGTRDAQEGLLAFHEQRDPEFRGD